MLSVHTQSIVQDYIHQLTSYEIAQQVKHAMLLVRRFHEVNQEATIYYLLLCELKTIFKPQAFNNICRGGFDDIYFSDYHIDYQISQMKKAYKLLSIKKFELEHTGVLDLKKEIKQKGIKGYSKARKYEAYNVLLKLFYNEYIQPVIECEFGKYLFK